MLGTSHFSTMYLDYFVNQGKQTNKEDIISEAVQLSNGS